jgi:enediyne biosynthesis protein E4
MSDKLGAETYWPWGISAGDLNADGFEDAFVSAGMGYPFRYAVNSLLLNDAGQKFVDAESVLGIEPRAGRHIEKNYFILNCSGEDKNHLLCEGRTGRTPIKGAISTRSAAVFDLDDDGDLDIVTAEFNDRPQVLLSNLAEKRSIHFVKIRLQGKKSNRDGLGATVKVVAGGQSFSRLHDGKSGYLSQSSLPLYFGLGAAIKIDRIEVFWPSGKKQLLSEASSINKLVTIQEPD